MNLLEEIYQFGPSNPKHRLFLMELALWANPNDRKAVRSLFGIRSSTRCNVTSTENGQISDDLEKAGWVMVSGKADPGGMREYTIAEIDHGTRQPKPFGKGGPNVP